MRSRSPDRGSRLLARRVEGLAGRGSLSASTSRSSSVRRGRATTPPPSRSGMSCISWSGPPSPRKPAPRTSPTGRSSAASCRWPVERSSRSAATRLCADLGSLYHGSLHGRSSSCAGDDVARAGQRVPGVRPTARHGARGAQRDAGGARRGRAGQDGVAPVRDRVGVGSAGRGGGRGGVGDGAAVRRAASALRAALGRPRAAPGPTGGRAGDGVRAEGGRPAGPVLRRLGGGEPAVGGGGGASAVVRGG